MQQHIRNKIIINFVSVITAIICVIVVVVSWRLQRDTAEQADLLAQELTSRTFSHLEGYYSMAAAVLDTNLEEVARYGSAIAHNSPIADIIVRQQNESIVEILQNSAVKGDIDFSLIFNAEGELQASSGGSRGYKPGDRDLPSRLESYRSFPIGQKIYEILKEEIGGGISPREAVDQEKKAALNGFFRLDPDILRRLGVDKEKIGEKGAVALVAAAIIRDEFYIPAGMCIVGRIPTDFPKLFAALNAATGAATFLYIDTTPIAYAGFHTGDLEINDGSLLEISPAAAAKIQENNLPTNIVLPLANDTYLSTCSSLNDVDQNKVGILCVGLPESEITAIQKPLLAHGMETQRVLQAWLVLIGAAMVVIFIFLARLLARGITRPLEGVVDFANKVGKGDLSRRMKSSTADEIGSLSRSIDTMLDRLQAATKEKENLEVHLRQVHKMEAIGTLAGGIAHDFNNILTGILGFAELAKCEVPAGSKAYSDVEQIILSGKRARDLVKQMLTFSRQEKMERIPLPLNLHTKEILKLLRATIPSTIAIHENIAAECHNILANPTEVHLLLMNLCTNAVQAMEKEGGILEIGVRDLLIGPDQGAAHPKLSPGLYIMLTVKDTGHGISPAVFDRIFDPFFTTKGVGKGTGMGLAVVHGIVENYGGVISVDSTPGVGTTFTIVFPSIDKQEVPFASVLATAPLATGKERILFVDDEITITTVQRRGLEQQGYTVTAFTNSVEALQLFKSKPDAFDLVITDYTMPRMTGEALARELHNIRADLPIILCTGYSEDVITSVAEEIGIREIVMKPIAAAELADIIRRIVDA
jgi:signal transduction histidine kinase